MNIASLYIWAKDMTKHLLDQDDALAREHMRTQRLYEDTHHGWTCLWAGSACGAD